jgi:general secretion pathway protein H
MSRDAGISPICSGAPVPGFTLVELLAALTIIGLVLAVSVPASMRFYQSMQYRSAVKDVISLFVSARHAALDRGVVQDVKVDIASRELRLNDTVKALPEGINVVVHAAAELNRGNVGVFRFYPEGGASGGGIDLEMPNRSGVRIGVDWLVGRVSQETYEVN